MPAADLLARLADEWTAATRHPFLLAVRDGTVPLGAFDTWLAQDAYFVEDLLWFQARLLARAPAPARPVLAAGAVALVDEQAWFAERADERGLPTSAPRLPGTEAYRALLQRLDAAAPATALTALWTVERVYLQAWTTAAPGAPEYRPFVAHWTTPEFVDYVDGLEQAADVLLPGGVPDEAVPGEVVPGEVERAVRDVLRAEVAFWDMAVAAA